MIEKEKLLLHHCCAPCSPGVVDMLSFDYELESFWFNPNIQPEDEYNKRKEAMEAYALIKNLKVHYGPEFSKELWQQRPMELKSERCMFCYRLRLIGTAKMAKKLGIKHFSTTLLSSPHQMHDVIRRLGLEIADTEKLVFVYKDFRQFYSAGKKQAKDMNIYMQKYCGCMPSLIEKEKEVSLKRLRRP